jgi:hypothetical protein
VTYPDDAVVWALHTVAPEIIAADFPEHLDHCILATRIGIEALRYFGIEAEPRPVIAMFFNKVEADGFDTGLDGEAVKALPGAWGVGIGVDRNAPDKRHGWNGHLVIEITGYLIDLNSGQASRPEQQMPVPSSLTLKRPAVFEGRLAYTLEDGVRAVYEPLADQRWRQAPDWRGDDRHRRTTGKVIRAMRKLLS